MRLESIKVKLLTIVKLLSLHVLWIEHISKLQLLFMREIPIMSPLEICHSANTQRLLAIILKRAIQSVIRARCQE